MTSSRRGRALHRLARRIDRDAVPGALVDCGVWNGGSTILLSDAAPERDVWAFDSFEGLPAAGPLDGPDSAAWTGECQGAEETLREGFRRYASPERLHVVKGWFDETFPTAVGEVGRVALLHADGDWYDSVLLTLRTFYPRVSPGGYVVIDDYGAWPGAKRAVDEFRREVGETAPMASADFTGRYWRKLR
jgi:O-methyltransferase